MAKKDSGKTAKPRPKPKKLCPFCGQDINSVPTKIGAPFRFPDPTGDPFIDKLIELRKKKNLSRKQLGQLLEGIPETTVQSWEVKRRKMSAAAKSLIINKFPEEFAEFKPQDSPPK